MNENEQIPFATHENNSELNTIMMALITLRNILLANQKYLHYNTKY